MTMVIAQVTFTEVLNGPPGPLLRVLIYPCGIVKRQKQISNGLGRETDILCFNNFLKFRNRSNKTNKQRQEPEPPNSDL